MKGAHTENGKPALAGRVSVELLGLRQEPMSIKMQRRRVAAQ